MLFLGVQLWNRTSKGFTSVGVKFNPSDGGWAALANGHIAMLGGYSSASQLPVFLSNIKITSFIPVSPGGKTTQVYSTTTRSVDSITFPSNGATRPSLNESRWQASVTTMPDGTVMTFGGGSEPTRSAASNPTSSYNVYNYANNKIFKYNTGTISSTRSYAGVDGAACKYCPNVLIVLS
jgi:hypothetical protein